MPNGPTSWPGWTCETHYQAWMNMPRDPERRPTYGDWLAATIAAGPEGETAQKVRPR